MFLWCFPHCMYYRLFLPRRTCIATTGVLCTSNVLALDFSYFSFYNICVYTIIQPLYESNIIYHYEFL